MNWGRLIKDLRAEAGMSQRQLAAASRTNRSTLCRIEAGKTSGVVGDIEKMLATLGYELDVLPALRKQKDRRHGEDKPGRHAVH